MATGALTPGLPPDAGTPSIWRAPLVPAALAVTAGVVLDRYAPVPLAVSLVAAAAALLAWAVARHGGRGGLPLVYLALAGVAAGAAWHHYHRDVYPPDDVGHLAPAEPRPVKLRGTFDEEPRRTPAPSPDPLRSRDKDATTGAVLSVTEVYLGERWQPVSGRVRLRVAGSLPSSLHAGDAVEVVGRLSRPPGPSNPGEFDQASYWRDRRVRAVLVVRQGPAGVVRLERRWHRSWRGWLGVARAYGQGVLAEQLPDPTAGLAQALLLGDSEQMTAEEWQKYVRTGVIHVLAISGQHLVVLAFFLWWALRLAGVRQRRGAVLVALFLLAYALLTGGRPPAVRATVTVCAACLGLALVRATVPANLFALAWLAVAAVNPADLFESGCLLSFLAVAVLYWGARPLLRREPDPLEAAADEGRPFVLRGLRWLGACVRDAYLVSALLWLAITPLAAARAHLVAPAGLLLGPPLVLLTSVALLAGFCLLALAPLGLGPLAAWAVRGSLSACASLVDLADGWRTEAYVPGVPSWLLWVLYIAFLTALTHRALLAGWRWAAAAGLGWLCVGMTAGAARLPDDELRCTFLAVGHGGCAVIEAPDGRTLLYDAGALRGPEVATRQIAPFLWARGVRRLDEVFLSHADLDHFNGLPALAERFAVGQVTCTPSFAAKDTPAVRHTLAELRKRNIPVRIVSAGDRLAAGAVTLDVLHPPAAGPDGAENVRSLVLAVRHAGNVLLLTGDLEGEGLAMLLRRRGEPVDVLQAPHHGSHRLDAPGLVRWAAPRLVVSCQGPAPGAPRAPALYAGGGATFWGTDEHGAVTVRSHATGVVAETFVTREVLALPPADGRGRR